MGVPLPAWMLCGNFSGAEELITLGVLFMCRTLTSLHTAGGCRGISCRQGRGIGGEGRGRGRGGEGRGGREDEKGRTNNTRTRLTQSACEEQRMVKDGRHTHLSLSLSKQPHGMSVSSGIIGDNQRRVFKRCHHLHLWFIQVIHSVGVVCAEEQTLHEHAATDQWKHMYHE